MRFSKVRICSLPELCWFHAHSSPWPAGDIADYVFHKKATELAHSFLFCSCVRFCLYGPFDCISCHKLCQQLPTFSSCSLSLIFALLVLLTIYLSMKVFLGPDLILCGWLGLEHQVTNCADFTPTSPGHLLEQVFKSPGSASLAYPKSASTKLLQLQHCLLDTSECSSKP